ncbi:class I SAM-dependent methyltransferase [Homoserinibacter sp. YIM 151385]|uniref:class I SAM-dependent methyltransferase n=1 Tax=Homoserinibacter sp. YIM 151385 TaxID=2985506 RepID=UPI0022F07C86|nr:methyltransferase domain-containing protein [Homoserinibacter sp. YIM 151385]WBU38789.1 methyltransferase domain-containing protein [Homoserinibacter sp. YIM 151385]
MDDRTSAAEFWEARYAGTEHAWSGRVNRVLEAEAGRLDPGTAIDLGCGEGGDAVWLAAQGWQTTGVDLSPTAIARGRAAADAAGIPPGRLELIAADLADWMPVSAADLVTASFLQSWPVEIPRAAILRRATGFVAAGGGLLVTAHVAPPSWVDPETVADHPFASPEEDLAALELDRSAWEVELVERRERELTGPDGQAGTILDGIVLVRRR